MTGNSLSLVVDDADERPAAVLGQQVGLEGVLADLDGVGRQARTVPIPGDRGAAGFCWDAEDTATGTWWPQGITVAADGGSAHGRGGRRVLLCGWYAKERGVPDTATRVSVVDLDAGAAGPRYAHVLLVEPYRRWWSASAGQRPVRVHAGGLAWWGHRLLVADTRHGVRVFDLDDLIRVEPGVDVAHGARYVLPQCGRWRAAAAPGSSALRWSFLALDATEPGALSLVAGEYARDGDGARLARWALDHGTGLPLRTEPEEVLRTDIASMQGATRVHGRYVVSASHGDRLRGHLWTGSAGGPWMQHAETLPIGPEDLSYDPATGRLWTQTEYPDRRYVLDLPLPP